MRVNSPIKAIIDNRLAIFSGIGAIAIAIFFISTSFTKRSETELLTKRVNLTIREIGHHLLLHEGDSTSRVLPVREISEGVFLLEFEHELTFQPDTLVALSQRILAKTGLPLDYTVTVHACNRPEIVYGFQISPTSNDIKSCSGRSQPHGCYAIQIVFAHFDTSSRGYSSPGLILSACLFMLGAWLLVGPTRRNVSTLKNEVSATKDVNEKIANIGKLAFDMRNQRLSSGDEIILLTDKECKILELLNQNFSQLTTREDLIQKIWVDEGVITGRSLDMFVSKLRKKLSNDPDLRITNVHGKGYKLEIVKDAAQSS
jgi:DNA-binding winged helix-turn-helix (wHTH) protein